jgi:hypothetical protein
MPILISSMAFSLSHSSIQSQVAELDLILISKQKLLV